MYLSGSQKIQKSMNGLLKISASDIDATNASITNLNNIQNINGAIGSDLVIDVDTGKIIQLKDNTQIDSSLNVIGNTNTDTFYVSNASTFNGSITCKGIVSNGVCTFNNPLIANSSLIARASIDVSTNSLFRKNLSVSGQLSVGGTSTFDGLVNVTKQLEVFENATFEKNVIVNEGIYTYGPTNQIDGSLSVFGYTKLYGELDVSGNTTLKQLTTSKPATFNDAVICNSTFDSYGNTTFNNPVITNSTLDLYGMLTVSGISIFNDSIINYSSLDVNGITTLNGNFNGNGSTNQFTNSVSILGSLNTTGNSTFKNNLDVSGNLFVGKLNPNKTSTLDVNGIIYLREPTNPNVTYMSIKYEPTIGGFQFMNQQANGYMYFSTKDGAGTIKSFQFNSGQLYSNIFTYIDNDLTTSFNRQYVLGDSNGIGTWFGVSQKYIPNTAVTSGHVTYNKGLMNNATYYSNWVHVNTSNVDVPTMRMSWQGIESKVPHTMENNLIVNGNITLSTVGKNITFPDTTQQATAFSTALNDKLTAIGTRVTSTLNATVQLTTGAVLNCGSISLTPGTYMISVFCYIDTQNGTTTVNGLSAAYSTSPTAYSHNVDATLTGGGLTYALGSAWSLNTTDCIVVASTTTYYMITRCVFGTANRLRFVNPFSKFTAVRIA